MRNISILGVALTACCAVSFADSITPYGVNDSGLIVGQDYTSAGVYESFIYDPTTQVYTFLTPPGATNSIAVGINDSGQIIGTYGTSAGNYGYLYSGGTYTTLSVPGAVQITTPGTFFFYANPNRIGTNAFGIDDNGDVIGDWAGPTGEAGFVYSGGSFTNTSISDGGVFTSLYGVNDSGVISGYTQSNDSSFIYSGGTFTPLNYPGATATIAQGINDSGVVVGIYTIDGVAWGFIYSDGTYTSFAYPGSSSTNLFGISNSGEIVGTYACSSNDCLFSDPAFYAIPTQNGYSFQTIDPPAPEPSTVLLFGAGLAGLVAARKRILRLHL